MAKHIDGVQMYYARNKTAWRQWLQKHSSSSSAVWLIYYKSGSGKTRVSYNDAVDQAICFGWIDSKPNKLDNQRSIQFFAPRKPTSNWSKINKQRVERLIKAGLMTPSGLAVINQAKKNGSWNALDQVEEMKIPVDLSKALSQNKDAKRYFMAFPRSSKRNILEWILNAKQPATRQKRIDTTVLLAAKNIRANHSRQPKGNKIIS